MKKNILFISFEEAQHICDKSQYSEATLWDKIKLNFRYIWCRATRKYVIKNRKLTKAITKADLDCLRPEELYELKHKFSIELKNQDQD